MHTLSSRMGLSEHWPGDPNRVLCVLTSGTKRTHIGTVGTPRGYCACSLELAGRRHVKQSSELAVRREVCYVGLCFVVFVRQVCHSAQHQNRPGDERLVYHPGNPTPHGISPWCGIHHMVPSMGYSECPHGAHAGTSSALTQRTHTRVRGTCVRMHACA